MPGWGTTLRYGSGASQPSGYMSAAASLETAGTMITSSPCSQSAGVSTCSLAVSWTESSRRRIGEVAAGGHRVGEGGLDLLVRADDEHRAGGGVVGGGAACRRVTGVGREHVVELHQVEPGVADQRVEGRVVDLVEARRDVRLEHPLVGT